MGKKVLIADDSDSVLLTAENLLSINGYEVFAAENGAVAAAFIKNEMPDFAILDIAMPEKTGLELCREIKGSEHTKNIIVIIISGNIKEIEEGFEYGADDCFIKPIDWDIVLARLENLSETAN